MVKAFGDMGQMARLRLIRDRFIAPTFGPCAAGKRPCGIFKPEPPVIDQLLQRLMVETQARQPAPESCSKIYFRGVWPQCGSFDRDPFNGVGIR